ncbi:MAG TPA: aldehyde dehydrogenase [Gammaproteobacteria bacterium]|nr:aldehyde dehydrogenase [Gammaproteobacteria bacterium]
MVSERTIGNWIAGERREALRFFDKVSPVDGRVLWRAPRSQAGDVQQAVASAMTAQAAWAGTPGVARGEVLFRITDALHARREEMARVVALETGKSFKEALGETGGAIAQGRFMAGEGQRLYGRTTTSGAANRFVATVRQPLGVAGLITAANTPIANVAWKVFPALICGNAAVLKAAEDAPMTAELFARIAHEAGLPPGLLNVIHGFGAEAGEPLVLHSGVAVISFTGSTSVGRRIACLAGERLAKVSLELGGKNPFVVCDDADLDQAVHWAALSAFSNAGQRCAAASRIIVFEKVYGAFRERLLAETAALRVGPGDGDDFGPVINRRQLDRMLAAVHGAVQRGARVLTGGRRLSGPAHRDGCYMAPTVLEDVAPEDELSRTELFGPITCLYRARDFDQALALANDSPYGLTACIHTRDVNRALRFTEQVQAGVAVVNAGTYGSEPHMPFGGVKASGNGTREPGTEALDVYASLKDVYLNMDPAAP